MCIVRNGAVLKNSKDKNQPEKKKSLVCCDPWGRRVRHDWANELNWTFWFVFSDLVYPCTYQPIYKGILQDTLFCILIFYVYLCGFTCLLQMALYHFLVWIEHSSFNYSPIVGHFGYFFLFLLFLLTFSSVQFSRSVVSDSLQPHELQQARPPCPSPAPRVHSNSRP